MTTQMNDGIVEDVLNDVKKAGTTIYDKTAQKVIDKTRAVITGGTAGGSGNVGINPGGGNPNGGGSDPVAPTQTSSGPSDMTKTLVIGAAAAAIIYFGIKYFK